MATSSDTENNNILRMNTQERKLYYRDLLNKVEDIQEREDVGLQTVQEIGEIIKQVDTMEIQYNIEERYQFPEETLLDVTILSTASSILLKSVNALETNVVTYDSSSFAEKILRFVGAEEEDLESFLKLSEICENIVVQVPKYECIGGTYKLDMEPPKPKEKKEKVLRQQEKVEKVKPVAISSVDEQEQGIEEIVKGLFKVLQKCYTRNKQEPINYYRYVIDTSSFENTIENMFYCSFLIRDGRAHIDLDRGGNPVIKPVEKAAFQRAKDNGEESSQMISSISMTEWETFKDDGFLQQYRISNKH